MMLTVSTIVISICLLLVGKTSVAQLTAPSTKQPVSERDALVHLGRTGYIVDTTKSSKAQINKQAIIAFQKVHKLKRSGSLNASLISHIKASSAPVAFDSIRRYHIEVDLKRQVLFIVDSTNSVKQILSVSTGNGERFFYPEKGWRYARTPKGRFKVYYKIKGVRVSKLGILFNPLYVVGGVAIHGALQVPATPASHGCIRIPMFASERIYSVVDIGTPVTIY